MSKHFRDGTAEPVSRDQIQAQPYSVRVPQSSQRDGYTHSNTYIHTIFSPNVENVWADAGKDSRTCLARPNSQTRMGTGIFPFPVQLMTRKIDMATMSG